VPVTPVPDKSSAEGHGAGGVGQSCERAANPRCSVSSARKGRPGCSQARKVRRPVENMARSDSEYPARGDVLAASLHPSGRPDGGRCGGHQEEHRDIGMRELVHGQADKVARDEDSIWQGLGDRLPRLEKGRPANNRHSASTNNDA